MNWKKHDRFRLSVQSAQEAHQVQFRSGERGREEKRESKASEKQDGKNRCRLDSKDDSNALHICMEVKNEKTSVCL